MNIINQNKAYIISHPSQPKIPRTFGATLLDEKNINLYKTIKAEQNVKDQFNKEKSRAKVIGIRACIVGLCASVIYFLFR